MTYFADLSPYGYSTRQDHRGAILNVGWLDHDHSFPVGDTSPEFIERLQVLCVWRRRRLARGFHVCEVCGAGASEGLRIDVDGHQFLLGSAEIDVEKADGTVFSAPNLIYHYVAIHRYLPPAEFVTAVMFSADAVRRESDRFAAQDSSSGEWPVAVSAIVDVLATSAGGLRWNAPSRLPADLIVAGAKAEARVRILLETVDGATIRAGDRRRRVLIRFRTQEASTILSPDTDFELRLGTTFARGRSACP